MLRWLPFLLLAAHLGLSVALVELYVDCQNGQPTANCSREAPCNSVTRASKFLPKPSSFEYGSIRIISPATATCKEGHISVVNASQSVLISGENGRASLNLQAAASGFRFINSNVIMRNLRISGVAQQALYAESGTITLLSVVFAAAEDALIVKDCDSVTLRDCAFLDVTHAISTAALGKPPFMTRWSVDRCVFSSQSGAIVNLVTKSSVVLTDSTFSHSRVELTAQSSLVRIQAATVTLDSVSFANNIVAISGDVYGGLLRIRHPETFALPVVSLSNLTFVDNLLLAFDLREIQGGLLSVEADSFPHSQLRNVLMLRCRVVTGPLLLSGALLYAKLVSSIINVTIADCSLRAGFSPRLNQRFVLEGGVVLLSQTSEVRHIHLVNTSVTAVWKTDWDTRGSITGGHLLIILEPRTALSDITFTDCRAQLTRASGDSSLILRGALAYLSCESVESVSRIVFVRSTVLVASVGSADVLTGGLLMTDDRLQSVTQLSALGNSVRLIANGPAPMIRSGLLELRANSLEHIVLESNSVWMQMINPSKSTVEGGLTRTVANTITRLRLVSNTVTIEANDVVAQVPGACVVPAQASDVAVLVDQFVCSNHTVVVASEHSAELFGGCLGVCSDGSAGEQVTAIRSSRFSNVTVTLSGFSTRAYSGAVDVAHNPVGKSEISIADCSFRSVRLIARDSAGDIGGGGSVAIYEAGARFTNAQCRVSIARCTFEDSHAVGLSGGAILWERYRSNEYSSNSMTIAATVFERCSADKGDSGSLLVSDFCIIVGGAVAVPAAVLSARGGHLLLSHDRFRDCWADFGGALLLADLVNATMVSCSFNKSSALQGAAMWLESPSLTVQLRDTTVRNASALLAQLAYGSFARIATTNSFISANDSSTLVQRESSASGVFAIDRSAVQCPPGSPLVFSANGSIAQCNRCPRNEFDPGRIVNGQLLAGAACQNCSDAAGVLCLGGNQLIALTGWQLYTTTAADGNRNITALLCPNGFG